MSYVDWYVGMKVVCIAPPEQIAKWQADAPMATCPKSNGVYTVREIRDDARWLGRHLVVLLSEISNAHMIGITVKANFICFVEPGFTVENFRPLQARKADISIFSAMLTGAKERERA
ncbi:hypothetical protein [Mesorhizobium amorphae]|uniref:hypothetical protein n=1 Tax=Mesorhizobium amorphae TaxID=71433 RepID=UPI0011855FEA|nr:hypothetical protein [Mesorhizobium amorphae]